MEVAKFKQEQIQKVEKYVEEFKTFKYNVNIYTDAKMVKGPNFEEEKK